MLFIYFLFIVSYLGSRQPGPHQHLTIQNFRSASTKTPLICIVIWELSEAKNGKLLKHDWLVTSRVQQNSTLVGLSFVTRREGLWAWVNDEEPVWERRNKRRSPQAEGLLKATAQELPAAQVLVRFFEYIWRNMHTDSTQISQISPQTGCGKAAGIYKGNLVKGDPSETCQLLEYSQRIHVWNIYLHWPLK